MLKEPFRRIRNEHFRSWWLIRLSSSALGRCWIAPAEWFAVSKTKTKTRFKLTQFHRNWCLSTNPHQTRAESQRSWPCRLRTSCNVRLLFCYYLRKAPTCEKGLNGGAVVSIKIHHIYSPFFSPHRLETMSLSSLSSRFHLCRRDSAREPLLFSFRTLWPRRWKPSAPPTFSQL